MVQTICRGFKKLMGGVRKLLQSVEGNMEVRERK
jgi:hypothetical protein